MKGKLALVVGAAAGYVLGAKAGQQRYQQIKQQADKVWHNPTVQEKAQQAQDLAKQKAPKLQEKAAQVAEKAGAKRSAGATAPATPASMPATEGEAAVTTDETSAADGPTSRPTPSAPAAGGTGV